MHQSSEIPNQLTKDQKKRKKKKGEGDKGREGKGQKEKDPWVIKVFQALKVFFRYVP